MTRLIPSVTYMNDPKKRILKERLINGSLLIMVVLLCFLGLEFAARSLVPAQARLLEDQLLGWSSMEYRAFDPAYAHAKKKRILFVGDSYLAGSGVQYADERFPIILKNSGGLEADVAVFASGGWGTDQQLLALKQKGLPWKPTKVVLAFCALNDLSNIVSNSHGKKKLKPYFVLNDKDQLRLHHWNGDTRTVDSNEFAPYPRYRSAFLDLTWFFINRMRPQNEDMILDESRVDKRYLHFLRSREPTSEIFEKRAQLSWSPQLGINHVSAFIKEDFPNNTYQWRLFEHILAEFKNQVESIGAEFILLILPVNSDPNQLETILGGSFEHYFRTPEGGFTFSSRNPIAKLQRLNERLKARVLDPTIAFKEWIEREEKLDAVWPIKSDRHFSVIGHKFLAEWLASQLGEEIGFTKGEF